ncbi:MAG: hypothetical protein AB9919_06780 [Geobacteraceae bacterium]
MPYEEQDFVSFANLGHGAAIERFDDEWSRLLSNLVDPNTTEAARTITLKVKVKPNKERSCASVDVACVSTLAPTVPFSTQMFVAQGVGKCVAVEHNPEQLRMDLSPGKPQLVSERTIGGDVK